MNFKFFTKYEKSISVTANILAIASAISAYVLSINPWFITAFVIICLTLTSVMLLQLNKRFRELEQQALSIANKYFEFSLSTYQESIQNRTPTFSELGYLAATLAEAKKTMGKDTSEIDALMEQIIFIESQSKIKK